MFFYLFLSLLAIPVAVGMLLLFMHFFVSSMDQLEGAAPLLDKPATLNCYHCGKETPSNRKICRHCGGELQ